MRIGFVGRYPPIHCGVAEYTRMLATFIKSISPSSDIVVFSTDELTNNSYLEKESKVKVYPSFRRLDNSYDSLVKCINNVRKVDILHVQHEYGIFGASTELLKALKEIKELKLAKATIITMHTVHHPLAGYHDAIDFQRRLNEYVDLVIVHSRLQEFELQVQGVNIGKIRRIPHGTLLNPYLGVPRNELLSSLGVNGNIGKPLLVLPGFIRRDKGIDVLLKSFDKLSKKPVLLIAGEPQDYDILKIIEDNRRYVILLKKYLSSDEILKVTASADIIVMPYRDKPGAYSVSGILHLSMGALKPIIGTRVPRLIELYEIAHRLTVTPENYIELAKVIEWTLKHYDYAVVYASTLYSYAVRVQWARMARRHLRVYRELLRSN